MNHRSLLDYLNESLSGSDDAADADDPMAAMRARLAEIERRLAAVAGAYDTQAGPHPAEPSQFASHIESIVRRPVPPQASVSSSPLTAQPATARRTTVEAPPLQPDMPLLSAEMSGEFRKFVEAVHLIGQAAERFRKAPDTASEVQTERATAELADKDAIRLSLVLKDTVSAFRTMTDDLMRTAEELRNAAVSETASTRTSKPVGPPQTREDPELAGLRQELERLQQRMGDYNSRKARKLS